MHDRIAYNSCRQKQLKVTILKYIFCNFIEEKVFFLFLNKNICYGYTPCDCSIEYPKHVLGEKE